jgi:hypothetical protein
MNPDKYRPENLAVFRSSCPQGENWVLSPGIKTAYKQRFGSIIVNFLPLENLEADALQ